MPQPGGILRGHGSFYDQCELEPVRNIQFPENLSQVSLDRPLGYVQPAGNLLVAFSVTDERGNFIFSASEICKQLPYSLLDLVLFLRDHHEFVQKMPAKRAADPQFTLLNSLDDVL